MNISLHLKRLLFHLVLLGLPSTLLSQIEYHEVLMNDTLHYEFHSAGNAPQITQAPSNGDYIFNGLENYILGTPGDNELDYIPFNNYLGPDTIKILYYSDGPAGPTQSFRTLIINVVEAYVLAHNDYTSTLPNTAIDIDVLDNDEGTGNLIINNIPVANHGSATISNNQISYTPAVNFSGTANLTYTVCDETETDVCDVATITIFVQEDMSYNDTTTIATVKNQPTKALFSTADGIQQLDEPEHGTVTVFDGGVEYTPDNNFVGKDTFSYAYNINTTTSIATFEIDVIYEDDPNILTVNDFTNCAINDSSTINVFDNDLNEDLSILTYTQSEEGGTVTDLGDGEFLYVAPSGFSGLDNFEYTANIPGTSAEETATVYIVVNNQQPALAEYDLWTAKNTPLIINYDIPISNFDFAILNGAINGDLEYYPGDFADYGIQVNGQDVEGYNLIIYYPDTDFVGSDDFQIEYCVGNDCRVVDVFTEIQEIPTPQADTLCVTECVWSGDANGDGKVDVADLLPIGYCAGEVGFERENATTEWYGQYGDNWDGQIGDSGINIKHVDTDGDGFISVNDTVAISDSYGLFNDLTVEPNPVITQIPLFFVPQNPNPAPGDKVIIDIVLGTENLPAINIHGITFALNFNDEIVEPGTMDVEYTNESWLSYGNAMMSIRKEPYLGRIESGYTRTTGISSHGYGIIGQVSFIVVDDIVDGNRQNEINRFDTIPYTFEPEMTVSMGVNGEYVGLVSQSFDIRVVQDIPDELNDDNRNLITFPNPTSDQLNIHVNGGHELEQVFVRTLTGRDVMALDGLSGNQTTLRFGEHMSNGIYIITAVCEKGVFTKKVELLRE